MSETGPDDFQVDLHIRTGLARASLLWVLLICFLTSCSSVHAKFQNSLDEYNDMLRWHKLDEASVFVSDALSEDYLARVKAAKNMKIFDYRVLRTKYNEAKNEAEVQVKIEYYVLSTNTLRSLVDVQKWAYVEENGSKQWKLMSLLPEFK